MGSRILTPWLDPLGVITLDDWAEIRRLHRSEQVGIKEIARRLGISRNTVRAALRSDRVPRYERVSKGSVVDPFEATIRALLRDAPRMAAPEIARRINWPYSLSPLKRRLTLIRPEYLGVDPVDRTEYVPGGIAQCDLWFPPVGIPVVAGRQVVLPVLAMTLGFSKMTCGVMIPTRQSGDILAGTWQLLQGWGKAPRVLVWDREAGIGGRGRPTEMAAGFVGTLGIGLSLAPPRDPEHKGMIERRNQYFESSFLPGRVFTSPADFNTQFACWMAETANVRRMRVLHGRPVDRFGDDLEAMVDLPATAPVVGLSNRVRLGRDYYVRIASNDYSVDPRVIGRFVDVHASLTTVAVTCDGRQVACHRRCWATEMTITDSAHRVIAKTLRTEYRQNPARATRTHADGHVVAIRALPDYDELFGVNFDPDDDHTVKGA